MKNFKTDTKFHDELRTNSIIVYKIGYKLDKGYSLLKRVQDDIGFSACVLKKDNKIIIVYGGTNDGKPDLKADVLMWAEKKPGQFYRAEQLYKNVAKKYKDYDIITTGHSLGGGMAQYVSGKYGVPTVTFNAYGVKNILKKENIDINENNIINYYNKHDFVPKMNAKNHVGKAYEMKSEGWGFLEYDHKLENQKPITEQKEIRNSFFDTAEDYEKYKQILDDTVGKIKKTTGELKEYILNNEKFGGFRPNNGGEIYIKEYTRKDGTHVKGHWRSYSGKFDPNKRLIDMDKTELNHALNFWLDEISYK